ncbi:MAG: glycosyltransferase family 4 protein [Candidatus Njordarchaeales archaeon]
MSRGSLKILMLTQFIDPTRGGAEVMFYQLANHLARRSHKVFIIKHRILDPNSLKDHLDGLPSNIIVYEVDPAVEHKGGLPAGISQNILYVFNSLKIGLRIIKDNRIDIIHCNTYSPVFAGWLLSRLTGVPLLVTIHDIASLHGYNFWERWMGQFGRFSKPKAFIGCLSELLTIKLSKNIHTVSETSRKDILSLNPKRHVYVIPNSLNLDYYKQVSEDEIEYGDFIMFVGRLVYYKHLEIIIEALRILKNKCNVKLVVLGDGPMRVNWENLVEHYSLKDIVEFKGYVSHEDKLYYLSKCRALVLPSTFEGFGIVVLEAWAFRKPVIVADVAPLTEIVNHERDGFIADHNSPEEWARYIKLLLEDKGLARKMGENGYEKLTNHYTIEKTVDELEQLYKQIIYTKQKNNYYTKISKIQA